MYDLLVARWPQLRREVMAQWSRLSDADLLWVGGHRERLIEQVQLRYGASREEAEREVMAFCQRLFDSRRTPRP